MFQNTIPAYLGSVGLIILVYIFKDKIKHKIKIKIEMIL